MRCVSGDGRYRSRGEGAWRGSRSSIMRPPSIDVASSPSLACCAFRALSFQRHFPTDVHFGTRGNQNFDDDNERRHRRRETITAQREGDRETKHGASGVGSPIQIILSSPVLFELLCISGPRGRTAELLHLKFFSSNPPLTAQTQFNSNTTSNQLHQQILQPFQSSSRSPRSSSSTTATSTSSTSGPTAAAAVPGPFAKQRRSAAALAAVPALAPP